jgi:hypothetical protein
MPSYVEYGGRATAPGDFDCRDGRFRSLVLKGDKEKIETLIDGVFNDPAGGAASFRVLSRYVLLQIGAFGAVRATTPPFDNWGTVKETMASIWVPLAQGRQRNGHFEAERIVMSVPFIWVDNPMSYAGGRETYGYPKSLGQFEFENGVDGRMSVKTFGGEFDRNSQADWHEVIKITPRSAGPESAGEHLEGAEAFIDHVSEGNLDPNQQPLLPGGIKLALEAIKEARAGRSHQLFLKQFRDASEPGGACYQEIIEARIEMGETKADFRPDVWKVEIAHLDSHPVYKELGVKDQETAASYAMDMEFICKRGKPVTPKPIVPALNG